MVTHNKKQPDSFGCPYMDRNDSRCVRHFSLSRLNDAFRICVNGFHDCPTHHALETEHAGQVHPITFKGQPLTKRPGLRPTGT